MAILKRAPSETPPTAGRISPFFSRNYGGYSESQLTFIRTQLPSVCERVADPMAGQAFLLSRLAMDGTALLLFDHNPGPLLLAALRDPRLIRRRVQLRAELMHQISRRRGLWHTPTSDYSDAWLPDWSRSSLCEYAKVTGLAHYRDKGTSAAYWNDPNALFYSGIALLAARLITTYRGSDNLSWLKPGGFREPTPFAQIVQNCCEEWFAFAEGAAQSARHPKSISCRISDIVAAGLPLRTMVDAIVTSPPYANRLDYTRMWAPEMAVFEALIGPSLSGLKRQQLGTNVVRALYPSAEDVDGLPKAMVKTLIAIRDDTLGKDSDIYYYPYFANYAIGLAKAIDNGASHVRRGGRFLLFVRDTVRKDVLFETAAFVEALMRRSGFRRHTKHLHVVRSHVGFRRKGEVGGLFGLAQREWWLSFERV